MSEREGESGWRERGGGEWGEREEGIEIYFMLI
jgi:hypothetical protein